MASQIGLRLATRSLRQSAVMSPSLRFGQRAMSSATLKASSDTPWMAAAGIITVGGLAATFSSGGDSKGSHHAEPHTSKPKPASKKEDTGAQKSDESKAGADNVEGDADPPEVLESVKQGIKTDEPSTAKAEEARKPGGDTSSDAEGIKDALARSEQADAPGLAKAAEEGRSK